MSRRNKDLNILVLLLLPIHAFFALIKVVCVFILKAVQSERDRPSASNAKNVKRMSNGAWLLNPGRGFPLTVTGVDEEVARQIQVILEDGLPYRAKRGQHGALEEIISSSGMRCEQIDEYIAKYRPIYLRELAAELISQSPDSTVISKPQRNRILAQSRQKAASVLNMFFQDCHVFLEEDLYNAKDLAFILQATYTDAAMENERSRRHYRGGLQKWEIRLCQDERACTFCKNAALLNPYAESPVLPLHLMCRCLAMPIL